MRQRKGALINRWWEQYTTKEEAIFYLNFHAGFSDYCFSNLQEELEAVEHILNRFADTLDERERKMLQGEKECLKMKIAGTWEAYEKAQREKTRVQLTLTIRKGQADGTIGLFYKGKPFMIEDEIDYAALPENEKKNISLRQFIENRVKEFSKNQPQSNDCKKTT